MDSTEKLAKAMRESGLKAKVWGGNRIYINGFGKEISMYILLKLSVREDLLYFKSVDMHGEIKIFVNSDQSIPLIMERQKVLKDFITKHLFYSRIIETIPNPPMSKPSSESAE